MLQSSKHKLYAGIFPNVETLNLKKMGPTVI